MKNLVFEVMIKKSIPYLAALVSIVITTIMDFTGYTNFSALPLFGLILIFWLIQPLSKAEIGLKLGPLKYYSWALIYPALVLGITALIAYIYGDFSVEGVAWTKKIRNITAALFIGPLIVLITEEGFFRGWLWGAFRKTGMNSTKTLLITSVFFMLWHVSAVTSGTEYGIPLAQVPIFLINVMLLGLIWGTMRLVSGSVIVPALCHAIWNGFTYEFFGFGEKVGALGITNTLFFGPEVGLLGIILNGAFFFWFWKRSKSRLILVKEVF